MADPEPPGLSPEQKIAWYFKPGIIGRPTQKELKADRDKMNQMKYLALQTLLKSAYLRLEGDHAAWTAFLATAGFPTDKAILLKCSHPFDKTCHDCGFGVCTMCSATHSLGGWAFRCMFHINAPLPSIPALPAPIPPPGGSGGPGPAPPAAAVVPAPAAGGGPAPAPVVVAPAPAPVVVAPAPAPVVVAPAPAPAQVVVPAPAGGGSQSAAPAGPAASSGKAIAQGQAKMRRNQKKARPSSPTGGSTAFSFISPGTSAGNSAAAAKKIKPAQTGTQGGGGSGSDPTQLIDLRDAEEPGPVPITPASGAAGITDENQERMMRDWFDPDPSTGKTRDKCYHELDKDSAAYKEVVQELFSRIHQGNSKLFQRAVNNDRYDTEGNSAIDYVPERIRNNALKINVKKVYQVQDLNAVEACALYIRQLKRTFGEDKAHMIHGYHGTSKDTAFEIVDQPILNFDRSKTIHKACGDGTYFDRLFHVANFHALEHSPDKKTGCIILTEIYYTKIADTSRGKRRPPNCDCGGSNGTKEPQWIVTTTNDNQTRIKNIIEYEWDGPPL